MANPRLISSPPLTKYVNADIAVCIQAPFVDGEPIYVDSLAGTTLYGANTAGDLSTTKHATFKQTISGNKAFIGASALNAPQNTTGGALSAANQLRVVALVDKVATLRARGDQVAAASTFIVGAGGGTAAGDATIEVKGTTAAALLVGSTNMSVASTGANTKTILVGDTLTVAGDTQVYTVTGTTYTLNGTTEVLVAITPPLQVVKVAAQVITVTAAAGKTFIFGTAPAVGADIEVDVLDAADVVTVGNTAGALTAGRLYDGICNTFLHAAGAVNISKAVAH